MIFYDFNIDPTMTFPPTLDTHPIYNYNSNTPVDTTSYSRITIPFSKASSRDLKKHHKFDVISILLDNYSQLKSAIDMQPDLITFCPNPNLKLRPGFIRDAIQRGIFFEITFFKMDMEWLRCIEDLLHITKGKGIVTGSGGCIKNRKNVERFLDAYLGKKGVKRVIENGDMLLKGCAMRRYGFRGVLSNNVQGGILKQNFIINRFIE